jgi:hypothetical protein
VLLDDNSTAVSLWKRLLCSATPAKVPGAAWRAVSGLLPWREVCAAVWQTTMTDSWVL